MVRNLPESAHLNLLRPHLAVQAIDEVVVEHWAVLVVDDVAQAVPDQNARDTEADDDANEGNDGSPLGLWILHFLPWLLNTALLDPPRAEVSLGDDAVGADVVERAGCRCRHGAVRRSERVGRGAIAGSRGSGGNAIAVGRAGPWCGCGRGRGGPRHGR